MVRDSTPSPVIFDGISSFDYASFRDKDLAINYQDLRPGFFGSSAFREWFEGEHNDWILYCTGEPRCGKTTFAAAIARYIRQHKSTSNAAPVLSVFLGLRNIEGDAAWETSNGVTTTSTSEIVLRGLLRQLLESQHVPSSLQTINASIVDAWSVDELKTHVCQALGSRRGSFIVFDALDECPEPVQIELQKLMLDLLRYAKIACTGLPLDQVRLQKVTCSANSCLQSGVGLSNWWYCQECDWHICWPCHRLNQLCLDESHEMRAPPFYVQTSLAVNSPVIKTLLENTLANYQQLDPSVVESLVVTILRMCGGSFSLASLTLNQLNGKNADEILEVSDRLPNYQIRNFNFFFAELEDQQPSNALLAKEAITLVAGSLDPNAAFSTMTLDDLVSALGLMNSESSMFETDITRPRVLQATRGFLSLDGRGVVGFAHDSLFDFVTNEWSQRRNSALVLRSLCLKALSTEKGIMTRLGRFHREILKDPDSKLPFLQYTLKNLGVCLDRQFSGSLESTVDLLESYFHSNGELVLAQLAMDRNSWVGTDKLHILPLFDSADILEYYLRKAPHTINVQDHLTGDTLAMLACDQCNFALLTLLLDPRNKVDFTLKCQRGNTAFWRAVRNGSGQGDRLPWLMNNLNDEAVNVCCESGKTALMLAIEEETLDDDTFAVLARHPKINLSVRDPQGRTAAHLAASVLDRNPSYLELIAQHPRFDKVSPLADDLGRSVMMVVAGSNAPQTDRLNMLGLLLSKGAELSSTDKHGRTVLHYAAATKFSSRVSRFLLSQEGNINGVQDVHGRTPLHIAIDAGASDRSIQVFKEHASGVLPQCQWRTKVIHLLKSPGPSPISFTDVDIAACDTSQNTILHLAVEHSDDPHVIQALLAEPLVNVNAENADGRTALHLALRRFQRTMQIDLEGERDDDDEAEELVLQPQLAPLKALLDIIFALLEDHRTREAISLRDHAGETPIDFAWQIASSSKANMERRKANGKPSVITNVLFQVIDRGAKMDHLSQKHVQEMFEWTIKEASLKANTWPNAIRRLVDAGADVLRRIRTLGDMLPWQAIIATRSSDHKEISGILEKKETRVFEDMRHALGGQRSLAPHSHPPP